MQSSTSTLGTTASKGNPFLFLVACAAFMMAGIMLLAWLGSPPVNPVIGKRMPKMQLEPLLGSESKIDADHFSGSAVVFYLWGPWNSESRQGYQKISEFYRRFGQNPRIQFVSVAFPKDLLDADSLRAQAQETMNEVGCQLPLYYDPYGQASLDLALLMPFGSMGFPTTIVTDESGKICRLIEGIADVEFAELENYLIEYSKSK